MANDRHVDADQRCALAPEHTTANDGGAVAIDGVRRDAGLNRIVTGVEEVGPLREARWNRAVERRRDDRRARRAVLKVEGRGRRGAFGIAPRGGEPAGTHREPRGNGGTSIVRASCEGERSVGIARIGANGRRPTERRWVRVRGVGRREEQLVERVARATADEPARNRERKRRVEAQHRFANRERSARRVGSEGRRGRPEPDRIRSLPETRAESAAGNARGALSRHAAVSLQYHAACPGTSGRIHRPSPCRRPSVQGAQPNRFGHVPW